MLAKLYRQSTRLISISTKKAKLNYRIQQTKATAATATKTKRSYSTTKDSLENTPNDNDKKENESQIPQRTFVAKENATQTVERENWVESMTPKKIVERLDRFIIGQNKAKRAVSVSLRNRWRRQQLNEDMKKEVMPMNILMMGPTGTGKV